jgi:phosphoribosylformylglycinamidine cyclo-ligase
MPGFYADGEYDIAGFTVGVVDRDNLIDGSSITVGNRIIGLASTGLHSNGYSLARKVMFERMGLAIDSIIPETGNSVADELLTPTKIYVKSVLNLLRDFTINGIAHITGGGLLENIPRVLPGGCKAVLRKGSWPVLPIFTILQNAGNIEDTEMLRTLNCGIGMVLVVPEDQTDDILIRLSGLNEKAFIIGEIAKCDQGNEAVELV